MKNSRKKAIRQVLSFVLSIAIVLTITPIYAIDGIDGDVIEENINTDTQENIDENDYPIMNYFINQEVINLSKIAQTDTSITVTWDGVANYELAYYSINCNDVLIQNKINDLQYTITNLENGSENSISVSAWDVNGNVIGTSETMVCYTDWVISNDVVLTSNKFTGNIYLTSGTLTLNGNKLYVDGDFNMSGTNGGCGYGYLIPNIH